MKSKRILRKYDGKKLEWLHSSLLFAVLLVVFLIASQLVLGISRVDGASMSPTLEAGNTVLYLRPGKNYERGDIVTISMPSGEFYIKRVVGLPGDQVDIRGGKVYVNGAEEFDDNHIGITDPQSGGIRYPITVEEGRVFVLGDNREASVDSRTFGTVRYSQIKGKMLWHF